MRVGMALGDPNGIGPEIAIKAAARFSGAVLVGEAAGLAAADWRIEPLRGPATRL